MQLTEEFKDLFGMSSVTSLGLLVASLALWYSYEGDEAKKWVAKLTTLLSVVSVVVLFILAGPYKQPSRVSLSDVTPQGYSKNHLCEQHRRDSSLYGRR